jgi:YVTN family beta-propeller protein
VLVLPDGRKVSPAGTSVETGGFPADVIVVDGYALVTNAHRTSRSLQVVRTSDAALVGETARTDAFPGLAREPGTSRVWASGGNSGLVEAYDVGSDGALTAAASITVGGYPTGLAFDGDATHLWAAQFTIGQLSEVDLATQTVTRTVDLDEGAYGLAYSAATDELWVTAFADAVVFVVDVASGTVVETLDVGANPADIVASEDGTTMYVAVSDDDEVVAYDVATRAERERVRLGEASITGADGERLPGTSPSALALDETRGRLYVTRAGDNAVDVLDAETLTTLGSIPTGWYPTALALDGDTLVVADGKGIGTGPNADGTFVSDAMVGTLQVVPLDDAALPGWTAEVEANTRVPDEVYPFDCDGDFPVPRAIGDATPIEHVVLIVRENKTYDALLGDLAGADGDASLLAFDATATPNLHALAARFGNHDNFYATSESSVQGHLALTSGFVNEYMERAWIEDYHGVGVFADDAAQPAGRPGFGSIFSHLLHHGVDFVDYGEIVGAFDTVDGRPIADHVDLDYPGGFFNTDVLDTDKATYVADQIDAGTFPPFVYVSLPDDHTHGTSSGELTADAMVSDNDYATGLLIDRISHSPYWASTVIFLVEDDPQSTQDHVDAHRSILLVASPWVKGGVTSHVHTSYPSVYRTIFSLLGLPPLSRHDALATPLWDIFTSAPDYTPYDVVPRQVADDHNDRRARGHAASACLDLSGPDRNPFLGDILYWQRHGAPPAGSALARMQAPGAVTDCRVLQGLSGRDDDDDTEEDAWDDAWRQFDAWKRAHPGKGDHVVRRPPPAWMRGDG